MRRRVRQRVGTVFSSPYMDSSPLATQIDRYCRSGSGDTTLGVEPVVVDTGQFMAGGTLPAIVYRRDGGHYGPRPGTGPGRYGVRHGVQRRARPRPAPRGAGRSRARLAYSGVDRPGLSATSIAAAAPEARVSLSIPELGGPGSAARWRRRRPAPDVPATSRARRGAAIRELLRDKPRSPPGSRCSLIGCQNTFLTRRGPAARPAAGTPVPARRTGRRVDSGWWTHGPPPVNPTTSESRTFGKAPMRTAGAA